MSAMPTLVGRELVFIKFQSDSGHNVLVNHHVSVQNAVDHVLSKERKLCNFHVFEDVHVAVSQDLERRGHVVVLEDLVTRDYALVVVQDRQRVQRPLHVVVVASSVLHIVHEASEEKRCLTDRGLEVTVAHGKLQEVVASVQDWLTLAYRLSRGRNYGMDCCTCCTVSLSQ